MINTPNTWPALEIAYDEDGLISLTAPSPGFDDPDVVRLHPGQVVDLAQKLGLGGQANPAALRVIATMKRRMKVLADRIKELDEMLVHCGHHEDLDAEKTYSFASWEISTEFMVDLDDLLASVVPLPLDEPTRKNAGTAQSVGAVATNDRTSTPPATSDTSSIGTTQLSLLKESSPCL